MGIAFMMTAALVALVITYFAVRTRRFQKLAYTDSLTKLPNRAALAKQLEQAVAATARTSRLTAVIFFDLDHFKAINDRFGHSIGDRVLRQAASRLASGVRQGDTIARFGGDEFVVVANNLRKGTDAHLVYRRLIAVLELPFKIGSHKIKLAASAGIATSKSGKITTADELIQNADAALYRAKAAGRGVARIFTPTPS